MKNVVNFQLSCTKKWDQFAAKFDQKHKSNVLGYHLFRYHAQMYSDTMSNPTYIGRMYNYTFAWVSAYICVRVYTNVKVSVCFYTCIDASLIDRYEFHKRYTLIKTFYLFCQVFCIRPFEIVERQIARKKRKRRSKSQQNAVAGGPRQYTNVQGGKKQHTSADSGPRQNTNVDGGPRQHTKAEGAPRQYSNVDSDLRHYTNLDGGLRQNTNGDGGLRHYTNMDGGPRQYTNVDGGPRQYANVDGGPRQYTNSDGSRRQYTNSDGGPRQYTTSDGSSRLRDNVQTSR